MVAYTTTYNLKKPTVADDEDVWGGYLNDSMDLIDDVLDGTTPVTGIDINSGTLDNVTINSSAIGGTTAAAGTFTTLSATTSLGVTGNITVSGTVDGRDVAADGTKLDGIEANADVTDTANVTAAGALMTTGGTLTGNVNFGDNDKAIFGAGSDLQIYHDGSNSYVSDQGTGNLNVRGTNLVLGNASGSNSYLAANDGGGVYLYYAGQNKIETTSTGIDVTGNVAVSGTVDGRDVASDGSKLDGIESGATGDQTASEILTAIKTVDGSGSGLDADTVDGIQASSFLRSDANDTTTGVLTVDNELSVINGNGTYTLWNWANGSTNYIRGTNTTVDTPIDMNNNQISDVSNIYVNDWFRNNNAGEGLYNEATGAHFMSEASGQWTLMDADSAMNLRFETNNGSFRGSVYADSSNNIGFIDAAGSWGYRLAHASNHAWNISNTQYMHLTTAGLFLNDGSVREDYDALSGTTPTCNVNNGGAFSLTMTGNTTFTFTSPSSGYSTGFVLQLTGNGSTVTWPSSVKWAGGTAPDAPASGETDIYVFWTRDGGSNWYGVLSSDAAA